MKRGMKLVLALVAVLCLAMTADTAFAAQCGGVETSIFECSETGAGAIGHVIFSVVDIMTIGVGILGVLGVTIVGIQYLTAGGSEEKTRKAKRRMFEIIIGLVAYALLFGFVKWLGVEPDKTVLNNVTTTSTSSKVSAPVKKEAPKVATKKASGASTKNSTKKTNAGKNDTDEKGTSANGKKLINSAQTIAKEMASRGFYYRDKLRDPLNWAQAKEEKRLNCYEYVCISLQEAGLIPKNKMFCLGNGTISCTNGNGNWDIRKDKNFKVTYYNPGKSISSLVSSGKMVPGDIVGRANGWHTMIYRGRGENGSYYFYSVNSGRLTEKKVTWKAYPATGYNIGVVIHPK